MNNRTHQNPGQPLTNTEWNTERLLPCFFCHSCSLCYSCESRNPYVSVSYWIPVFGLIDKVPMRSCGRSCPALAGCDLPPSSSKELSIGSQTHLWRVQDTTQRNQWIPAFAGMTDECAGMTDECAGMTDLWAADVLICPCFDCAQHDMDVAHEDVLHAQQYTGGFR